MCKKNAGNTGEGSYCLNILIKQDKFNRTVDKVPDTVIKKQTKHYEIIFNRSHTAPGVATRR